MILAVIPARGGSTIRRQDMKEIYWVNGAVYVNCVADLTKDTSFNDNPVCWQNILCRYRRCLNCKEI